MTVTDALVGAGGYWQNADFYNTQFKVLRSQGPRREGGGAAQARRPARPSRTTPTPAALFMAHVGVEPVPGEPAGDRARSPTPTQGGRALGQHPGRRLHRAERSRAAWSRRSRPTSGCRSGWPPPRRACARRRTSCSRATRARTSSCPRAASPRSPPRSPSSTRTTSPRAGAAHRARGRAQAGDGDARAAGKSLDTVPQVAVGRGGRRASTASSPRLTVDLSRLQREVQASAPRGAEGPGPDRRSSSKARGGAGRADRGRAAGRVRPAPEARGRAARPPSTARRRRPPPRAARSSELEALKKEAESRKNLYEVLLQKLNETRHRGLASAATTSRVVERASRPAVPGAAATSARSRSRACVLGLALGVGLVLARDYLDNTIKDPEEIERYLHLDLLAAVPRYEQDNAHLVTEAYQNLRTALLFARKDEERGQVVLVTGTAPQEGKTTTLVNIAQAARRLGREDGGARLRPAPRPAPPPAGPRPASRGSPTSSSSTMTLDALRAAHRAAEPLRAHRGAAAAQPARAPRAPGRCRTCSRELAARASSGSWSTRRPWPR